MRNKTIAYIAFISTLFLAIGPFVFIRFFNGNFGDKSTDFLLIMPAGYSFVIFYVIYFGFIATGIYQLLPAQISDPKYVAARKYIIINSVASNVWLFAMGTRSAILGLLCVITVLFTLYQLAIIFELHKNSKDRLERFMVKVPVSFYFGWICIIAPITFTGFLVWSLGVDQSYFIKTELWAVFVLIFAFLCVVYLYIRQKVDLNYILTIIWGYLAIFVSSQDYNQNVAFTALGLCIGLLVTYVIVERQQMELNKIQMELTALRNQVNPHFLFNNLNTLANLIPLESEKAHNYLDKLSKFYRYVVSQPETHLITLKEELVGVDHYIGILKERFGEDLIIEINCDTGLHKTLPPLSLQLLIENAVKHNAISGDQKLQVHITVINDAKHLQIENNINERIHILESTGIGLNNIQKRYQHFTKKKVAVETSENRFCVSLPLMDNEYEHFNNRRRG